MQRERESHFKKIQTNFFFFVLFACLFVALCVYNQLKHYRKLNPEATETESVWSVIKVIVVLLRVRGRGILGRHVQSHKNSRFQLLPIVSRKTHQSKKQHNMITDERKRLIKIPFVMLSVDHFIYKSILYTTIKGWYFKRILQCSFFFSPKKTLP